MKPWLEVAVPHRDICEGRFDESVFAADLGNVVLNRGPVDYTDAETFFARTYMTRGLNGILRNVLERLAGQGGRGVIQLQTPFGGGKTHTLVAIYHFIKNGTKVVHLPQVRLVLDEAGLKALPQAKVAAFVGTYADVLGAHTPWGELARQLGLYELVREHDRTGVAPGKEKLLELLSRTGPVVLLLDEILEYAVKAQKTIGTGQVLAFLQELTEVVSATSSALLVLTLPSSVMEVYDEEAEKLLNQLQRVAGRVETILTPVEGEEIYEVVRRRLFESVGDEGIRSQIASSYFEYYRRFAADMPAEAREISYREKIKMAYPLHPELIDLLYERWGSLPTFQRTRGVLRLLALIVADLYRRQVAAPLIHPSHVNLGDPRIRREFVKHIGSEYDSVIASDLVGERVEAIDAEMGTEYQPFKVASGVATALFLSSFSGAQLRRGATLGRLKLAFLREGLPPTLVEGALQRLRGRLWYLHDEQGTYYFDNRPNLNRVIVEKEEGVREQDIEKAIEEALGSAAGTEFAPFVWPEAASEIGETKKPALVLLRPEYSGNSGKTAQFVQELLKNAGSTYRTYKNTLFVLAVGDNDYAALQQVTRRYLALARGIKGDPLLWARLSKEDRDIVEDKIKDVSSLIADEAVSAYRYLYLYPFIMSKSKEDIKPENGSVYSVYRVDLEEVPSWKTKTVGAKVRDYLKDKERLLGKIDPEDLVKFLIGNAERKTVSEIWEDTLRYPGMPLLENEQVLYESVREGVGKKLFGAMTAGKVYLGDMFCPVDAETVVLQREAAEKLIASEGEDKVYPPASTPGGKVSETQEPPQPGPEVRAESGLPKEYKLRVSVPWDRVSDVVGGVIGPLKRAGCDLMVILELTARSETGIREDILKLKVRETLRQIGAQILDEKSIPS